MALSALLLVWALPAGAARAEGTQSPATIAATFHPDKLGGLGSLSVTIDPGASELGEPPPLRRAVVRLPAGMGVEIPHLRSCNPARLRRLGARGCQAQSLLGVGHALAQAQLGSQLLGENVSLRVFLGPLNNLQPTFVILAQGYTPFDERFVLTGSVLPDNPPYGEDLVLSVPVIPTLPLEPEASIVSMSLSIGVVRRTAREPNAIIEPSHCPSGGFPFATVLTYAEGSEQTAASTAACP